MSTGTPPNPRDSKILSSRPMDDSESKWVGLRAIEWVDPSGRERRWECADRKTRNGEVDGTSLY